MAPESGPDLDGCWLRSGDTRLRVQVAGAGAPLVLVHGWAMDHRVFRYQLDAFARHFKVVSYDRRGFGASSGPADLGRELDDLDVIARELAAGERFHLLGLSQGGRMALRYAATRPERLRSLVLQGAAVDGLEPAEPDEEPIPMAAFTALARAGRLDELRRRWLEHPMMRLGDGHPQAEALLREMLADYSGADLLTDRHAHGPEHGPEMDVLGALAATELPVLVLTGAGETASRRRMAAGLVAGLPSAREVALTRSGHLCNLTEPDAYNSAVITFCLGVDRGTEGSAAGAED